MFNFSHPASQIEEIHAPQEARQTWIGMVLLAVLAALVFTLAGATLPASKPQCRLYPRPLLTASEQSAMATSRGGAPCLIAANNSDERVESLQIVTPPANGWIATRGKGRLVYFPNADFKGIDSFELKLVRRTDVNSHMISTINMRVRVN